MRIPKCVHTIVSSTEDLPEDSCAWLSARMVRALEDLCDSETCLADCSTPSTISSAGGRRDVFAALFPFPCELR